jgi:Raf kinase inhibitor-like YbhB/YbcL family protein
MPDRPVVDVNSPRRKISREPAQRIELASSAFADGERIPERHTAFGEDVSPRLFWSDVPPGTMSLALLFDDPDSSSGLFVHWLAWNIPPSERELDETTGAGGGRYFEEGENGFGTTGYAGPKPPPGKVHRYVFRLYALDTRLALPPGANRTDFEQAILGRVLGEGRLTGTYSV